MARAASGARRDLCMASCEATAQQQFDTHMEIVTSSGLVTIYIYIYRVAAPKFFFQLVGVPLDKFEIKITTNQLLQRHTATDAPSSSSGSS